ncbi:4'-phosphopantetheinyl transferase superfamily protein [Duganella sp. LX20W]|uniref:4'-phosphopantetheinyl transferase superfamily protein n=1 Tax=Rugamonas brunnea TaxID=2758569 RepID=A0A7W2ESN4_9BURK|nr:4'-phosphopantetheinyl transferase superfamily protein [Rugamonas brunnea]MBA5637913.1 4'-phosphopantetheinyl transferase superfamily protein [Rugamonas brunnea]
MATMNVHDGVFPVQPWPGPLPVAIDGRCVIALATAGRTRPQARQLARDALRQVLAGWLSIDGVRIGLPATPGQPQRIVLDTGSANAAHSVADPAIVPCCSISHETDWTLVAISLDGPVGVDLMVPQEIEDWAALARDYLGPAVAQALAACPAPQRARALAQAWTAREASLKCAGQGLTEWSAAPVLACHTVPLLAQAGWVGSLAWPAKA